MTEPDPNETSERGAPGRNDPCPCGSGRKHKNCCLGRVMPETSKHKARSIIRLGLLVMVLFLLGIGVARTWLAPEQPEPWQYDEANDRHWHPGHNHWHQGPPPAEHR